MREPPSIAKGPIGPFSAVPAPPKDWMPNRFEAKQLLNTRVERNAFDKAEKPHSSSFMNTGRESSAPTAAQAVETERHLMLAAQFLSDALHGNKVNFGSANSRIVRRLYPYYYSRTYKLALWATVIVGVERRDEAEPVQDQPAAKPNAQASTTGQAPWRRCRWSHLAAPATFRGC